LTMQLLIRRNKQLFELEDYDASIHKDYGKTDYLKLEVGQRIRNITLTGVSDGENNRNRQEFSNNSLSFPGVSYNIRSRKYRALIMINGKSKHLGYFKTPNEAFAAYRNANLALFGAFPPSVTRDEFKAWSDRVETLKLIYPDERRE
jgi:hypothetical protein